MNTETIFKELQRIQAGVPKALMDAVVIETDSAPEVTFVVEKALEDPDFPEEKKAQLRLLKETGQLGRKVASQDPKVAKQIDQYVSREIAKSVKAGRLPSKAQLKRILSKDKKNEN